MPTYLVRLILFLIIILLLCCFIYRTIKELLKQIKDFFDNTIYIKHGYLVYHYNFIVCANDEPRSIRIYFSPTSYYETFIDFVKFTSTRILITNNVVKYSLPKHAVVINSTLKEIVVSSCTALRINNYLCSAKLHTRHIYCVNNSTNWFL